jgi:hypothetical protein
MGVLEDAIREHLDLKRRHGATDEELNQQEAEALGPARRDVPETTEPEAAEAVEEPVADEFVTPDAEPPEAALPTAGPEAPPPPADQDTAMYAPGEAPDAAQHQEDPDFRSEPPKRRPRGDFDFD